MESWSWDEYVANLRSKGYEFWELRDNKKILRGYVLKKGNAGIQGFRTRQGAQPHGDQARKHVEKAARGSQDKDCFDTARRREIYTDYISDDSGSRTRNGTGSAIPAIVPVPARTISTSTGKAAGSSFPMKRWTYSMTSSTTGETANSRDLTDMAAALFVGMLDTPAVPSGGGGGSSNDLPLGKTRGRGRTGMGTPVRP